MSPTRIFALIFIVACSSRSATTTTPTSKPNDVRGTIIELFDKYDVVGLPETHANKDIHTFFRALVADPRLVDKGVTNIVVEFGNARMQDAADRYVRGETVPEDEVRAIWRDTTQFLVWDSPLYEEFFRTVRDVNRRLPPAKQFRVLLGDPPIDWSNVRTKDDYAPFLDRDQSFASVIEKQVLARHQKALVIAGGMHLLYADGPVAPSTAGHLRRRYPDRVFMFWLVSRPSEGAAADTPEARIARGTPLGTTKFTPYGSQDVLVCSQVDGKPQCGPPKEWETSTVAVMTDGLLYYGPTPTTVHADPATYRDRVYADELRRRAAIIGRDDVVKELEALP